MEYQASGKRHSHSYTRNYAVVKAGQFVTVLVDPRDPGRALRMREDALRPDVIGYVILGYLCAAVLLHGALFPRR